MGRGMAFYRNMSLKRKLMTLLIPFISAVILIIGGVTYQISTDKLAESKQQLIFQHVMQTNRLIDFELEMYLRKCEMIFSSQVIQEVLGGDYSGADSAAIYLAYHNLLYKNIEPMLQDLVYPNITLKPSQRSTGTDMIKVEIYASNDTLPKDGQLVKAYAQIEQEAWVGEMMANLSKPYFRSAFLEDGQRYVSINRVLRDFGSLKFIGVLSIKIPLVRIEYLMQQDNEHAELDLYLLDAKGQLIAGKPALAEWPEQQARAMLAAADGGAEGELPPQAAGEPSYIYARILSELSGWTMLSVYPYSAVLKQLEPIKSTVAVTLVAGVLFAVLLIYIISVAVTRRLEKIKRKMEVVKQDRNIALAEVHGNDEIGQLDRSLNEMVARINSLVEQEQALQAEKSGLQVELLQSQINPHLLYNTLAAIKWRARQAGVADVSQVTDRLIRFFKYFLNKGAIRSSLGHELQMIAQYIEILKFTYEMELEVSIQVAPEIYAYDSLNLILQPIVENAIIHGLRPLGRPGLLEIIGIATEEGIRFTVKDNGIGMEPSAVEKLNADSIYAAAPGPGYGIRNVKRRIRLYFGERYGVQFTSEPGVGTEATLTLPLLPQAEADVR